MNEQQRDYAKAKQAKRRVEMKMEAREKSFLKGRGLMDSEGTEADSLYKIEDAYCATVGTCQPHF